MADVSFGSSHEHDQQQQQRPQQSNCGVNSPLRCGNDDVEMPMTSFNRRRSSESGIDGGGGGGGGSFHRSTQFHEKTTRNGSHATPFNEQSSIHSCSDHNSENSQTTAATAQSRPLPDQSAFDRSVSGVGGGGLNSSLKSFASCPATPGRNASFCPATPLRTTPSWGLAQPSSGSARLSERSTRSSHNGPLLDISDDQLINTSSYNSSSSSSTGYRCVLGRDDRGVDGNGNNVHNVGGNSSTKSQDLNHSTWLSRQQSLTANKGTL